MKTFLKTGLFTLLFFSSLTANRVFADAPPPLPRCTGDTGYLSDTSSGIHQCGLIDRHYHISLGNYANKFVLLDNPGMYESVDFNKIYKVIPKDGIIMNGKETLEFHNYSALDKTYFDTHGRLKGIFVTTNFTNQYVPGQVFQKMTPINSTEFTDNSYDFVVSKDDPLAKDYSQSDVIDNLYIKVGDLNSPTPYPYEITSHLECGQKDPLKCKKEVFYVPKTIVGHHIVLTKGNIQYLPANIAGSEISDIPPDPTSSPTNTPTSPVPSASLVENKTALITFQDFPNSPFFRPNQYLQSFIFSLILTLISETLVLLVIFNRFVKQKKTRWEIVLASFFANSCTLPYVWFVFPLVFSYYKSLIISELFAFIVEIIFYHHFLKLSKKQSLLLSLIANLVSFLLGMVINY
jgi:hypothetical protein